ncbi:MAG: mercuric reductase [Verrucomicrobiales bacterium]|nr:mercuric reductase [Verrucomicrobiales bacterium]
MIPLTPLDSANRALLEQVRPADWRAPAPSGVYDLVVIGAGTAGLVTAAGAATLGARVALVERHLMGGDCLNFGCVPSKSLLRSAHVAAELRRAGEFGIRTMPGPEVDFSAVMERLRRLRAGLAPNDAARRFAGLGVDVFFGEGRFVGAREIEVAGKRLPFHRAVIATGARAAIPEVPGLTEADPLTNETVFNLTRLPPRLAVLGGGPVGCELAQAFARLGSKVTLIHKHPRVLDRDDADAAMVVQQALMRDGIQLRLGARLSHVDRRNETRQLHLQDGEVVEADALLVATGRIPNIQDLQLDAADVIHDIRTGVRVDDFLRTSNPRIFACGDVCLSHRFTHAADAAARIVIQNSLFALGPIGRRRWSNVSMAWCTFTDPELAHTGWTMAEAARRGVALDTFTQPFEHVDRAITDSDTEGFIRVHTRAGTDRIVGATIVGRGAGDLISEVSLALAAGTGLGRLATVIHPYPTRAEAIRKCGDQFNKRRWTPGVARFLSVLLRLSRIG